MSPTIGSRLTSPAVPLEGGTLKMVIPPEIGTPPVVELRYVLYRMPGGFFFDFVLEDLHKLDPPVQAWLWARREVMHWMLRHRVETFLDAPPLPPEVDVH